MPTKAGLKPPEDPTGSSHFNPRDDGPISFPRDAEEVKIARHQGSRVNWGAKWAASQDRQWNRRSKGAIENDTRDAFAGLVMLERGGPAENLARLLAVVS